MKKIRIVVVGLGIRGKIHLASIVKAKEYFDVVGICDIRREVMEEAAAMYGISRDKCYDDAENMLCAEKPDAMAFVTMPDIRLSMIQLAQQYGVKGVLFEKPMALSLNEAKEIKKICKEAGMKAVVCQQHKYLRSFQLLEKAIKSGELGKIYEIRANTQAWASQLGTHYIDYIMWANGFSKPVAVVGHVNGSEMLNDSHSSPDYMMAQIAFENGVRGYIECGYFSKPKTEHPVMPNIAGSIDFWTDAVLTVYGEYGYVSAACNGRFQKFTTECAPKLCVTDYNDFVNVEQMLAQDAYILDFARWMQGESQHHPCDVELAYRGMEVLERKCVVLPLENVPKENAIEKLKKVLAPPVYDYMACGAI